VQVDVVVAAHDHERVTRGAEAGERLKHLGVVRGDQAQLGQRVVGRRAEPVPLLFCGRAGAHLARHDRHAHAREVDEIARDHQAPRPPAPAALCVPGQQRHELTVAPRARLAPRRVMDEIAPQVHVRQNEQIVSRHRGRPRRPG
jgi:hypothetical protein